MSIEDDVAYVVELGLRLAEEPRRCPVCHGLMETQRTLTGQRIWVCQRCGAMASV